MSVQAGIKVVGKGPRVGQTRGLGGICRGTYCCEASGGADACVLSLSGCGLSDHLINARGLRGDRRWLTWDGLSCPDLGRCSWGGKCVENSKIRGNVAVYITVTGNTVTKILFCVVHCNSRFKPSDLNGTVENYQNSQYSQFFFIGSLPIWSRQERYLLAVEADRSTWP
jgi:hypothetical protein